MWEQIQTLPELPGPIPVQPAAVLAALYEDELGAVRLLLTKRPDTMPTHPGDIAFPGGRWEPVDRSPVDTALREAEEEVGLSPEKVEVIGFLEPINTLGYSQLVVPVVGRLASPPQLVVPSDEVEQVFTPRTAELAQPNGWRWKLWRGRKVWFYPLGTETLWGATASMVRQLLGLNSQ